MSCLEETIEEKGGLLSIALGGWLIATSMTFANPFYRDSSYAVFFSEIFSGIFAVLLGTLFLAFRRSFLGWSLGIVGSWLQLVPLIFWAPNVVSYLNDTLIGVFLVGLSFHLAKKKEMACGTYIPKGWSFNPSAWTYRLFTVVLAFLCWIFSRYLAAYQLHYIDTMWDPFFKDGSLFVITSQISQDFPVSDAGLGAFCYTMECLLGWQGNVCRWRTMPWLVILFGVLVVPSSLVSIVLIILQPVVVGAWCSWCLATAICMLLMILLSGAEIIAALGCLKEAVEEGGSWWHVLWYGWSPNTTLCKENRGAHKTSWGFFPCWNLTLASVLGIYLMASPFLWEHGGLLSTLEYIIGPLIVTFAVLAMVEVYRISRYMIGFFGLLLVGAALIWQDPSSIPNWNAALSGLLAMILSLPRGKIYEQYGFWDRYIR